jgi:hypothetical protein
LRRWIRSIQTTCSAADIHREVVDLPAHERCPARGPGEHETGPTSDRSRQPSGQGLKGQRLERVAAEDRRRLVEGAVAGGAAAPQVVIVHRREVVVDERVGVDQLDGNGRRRSGLPGRRFVVSSAGPRGPERQGRPQPFARREHGVTHGLRQPRRNVGMVGERGREPRFDELPDACQARRDNVGRIGRRDERGHRTAGVRTACHAGA